MQSCPCGSQPNELHEPIQLGPVWGSYSNRSQSSSCMHLQISVSVCISMYQSLLLKYLNLFEDCGLRIDIASQHQTRAICSALFLQPPQLCFHAWGSAEFCKFWIYWPCRLGSKQFLAFSKSLSEFMRFIRKRQDVCRILLGSNKAIVFGGDGRRFKTPHGRAVRTGH